MPESPIFPKDATDRNRTSPFAFTGNKFEFRMVGSQANVADANIVLNTITADTFALFADELEKAKNFDKAVNDIITRELKAHYRIIFNEDGYGPEWEPEAEKRGLLNNKNTADAVPVCYEDKNIDVFVRQGVYTKAEAVARADIQLENYIKTINIEALTLLEMVKRDVIPAVSAHNVELCKDMATLSSQGMPIKVEKETAKLLSSGNDRIYELVCKLESILDKVNLSDIGNASKTMAHKVIPTMNSIRKEVDALEKIMPTYLWPYPSYFDLLYSVN